MFEPEILMVSWRRAKRSVLEAAFLLWERNDSGRPQNRSLLNWTVYPIGVV
jgi:hypothetical protein